MQLDVAMLLTGEDTPPTLVVARPDGTRWHERLEVGKTLDVPLGGRTVRLTPRRFFEHAARSLVPAGEIPDAPAGSAGPPGPALRVRVADGPWSRTTCVPLSVGQHAPPQMIDLPGTRAVWLGFSPLRLPLEGTVQVTSAEFQTYPASGIPKDYICQAIVTVDGTTGRETISLNHPVHVGRYQISQGSWSGDPSDPRQIVFLVASRPGLWAIWLGCAMICLGMPVAFYVKPLLMRRRPKA